MKKIRKALLGILFASLLVLAVEVIYAIWFVNNKNTQEAINQEQQVDSREKQETEALETLETTPELTPKPTPELTPKPTLELTPKSTPEPLTKVKLLFTGDLMVHNYQYEAAYNRETDSYDFSNNFPYVKKYIEAADYAIGNLETTLAGKERGYSSYPTFNTPDSFLEALKGAGFDLLTTANNHCVDKGAKAMLRTLDKLDEMGFDHTGTFASEKASKRIFIKEINGIKIAFINCTYGTNGMPVEQSYQVQHLNDSFYNKIKKARTMADLVIALPHNGTEYQLSPSKLYQEQYRKMLEAGADAIIGTHPHVLQPMEYQKIAKEAGGEKIGFVAYSLGNFISSQVTKPRDAGVMLQMIIKKDGNEVTIDKIKVIPTWCRFMDASGKRNFTVFSVYDLFQMSAEKRNSMLRARDRARIQEIQTQSTNMLLGNEFSIENRKKAYSFEKKAANFNRVYR